jgi:hypothetical protein
MNAILFPIEPEIQGQVLTDLQVTLRFLIDDGFFGFNTDEREAFTRDVNAELLAQKYGSTTEKLLGLSQDAKTLDVNGIGDRGELG